MTIYEQYSSQFNQKWHKRIIKTNFVTAAVILTIEIVYYFILSSVNLRTQTNLDYILRFIIIPASIIFASCICGWVIVYKSNLSEDKKSLAAILTMVVICCSVASIHNIFSATASSFFIPLSVSVVFGKKRITNIIGFFCIIGEIIAMCFASQDLRGKDPYFVLDCLMLFIVFGILWASTLLLMKNEQEKRTLIDNMWQEQSMLQRKVCRDELTGLYNLLGLQLFADDKIAENNHAYSNSSIAFLDIDDFKSVNDTFGHETGNFTLNLVADLISNHFSKNSCVARYGGDEFVVLLPGISVSECKTMIDSLVVKMANAHLPQINGENLTISCGVSSYGFNAPVLEAINFSDQAMYKAKAKGKNCTIIA